MPSHCLLSDPVGAEESLEDGRRMNLGLVSDVLGWLGAALLLGAYALVSMRKLEGDSVPFQLLNLLGSGFLIVNSAYYGAYPSVGVNVVWIGIAVFAIAKSVAGRR
jgi:ABC-type multidrug transport system permease subunit